MSPLATCCFNQLPVDILLSIFRYLDIRHILRLRRVSRYLNEVGRFREVWTDAYRNADFVHPPGPFRSQSTNDLENALVPCFRVDQNLRDIDVDFGHSEHETHKLGTIQYNLKDEALCVSLVFGKFVLVAFNHEVRSYYLDPDTSGGHLGFSIIYTAVGNRSISSFYCVSAVCVNGRPFACVVLKELVTHPESRTRISIYSLHVVNSGNPGVIVDPLHESEYDAAFYIHSVDLGTRVIAVKGGVTPSPSLYKGLVIAFDVHARTELRLPRLADIDQMPQDANTTTVFTAISTSTHILLVVSSQISGPEDRRTLFWAYTLPENPLDSLVALSQSHRGIISGIQVVRNALLHDAIVDPSTQDTLITIHVNTFGSHPGFPILKYGTLYLAKSPSDDAIGTITFQSLGILGQYSQIPFFHPSFNGTGRVFYAFEQHPYKGIAALDYDVRRYHANDDEKREAKIKNHPHVLWLPFYRRLLDYDSYCGRICLTAEENGVYEITIFDLATKVY